MEKIATKNHCTLINSLPILSMLIVRSVESATALAMEEKSVPHKSDEMFRNTDSYIF
jgi:hypothetical protein